MLYISVYDIWIHKQPYMVHRTSENWVYALKDVCSVVGKTMIDQWNGVPMCTPCSGKPLLYWVLYVLCIQRVQVQLGCVAVCGSMPCNPQFWVMDGFGLLLGNTIYPYLRWCKINLYGCRLQSIECASFVPTVLQALLSYLSSKHRQALHPYHWMSS